MAQEHEDGELGKIQNYIAFDQVSSGNLADINKETNQAKLDFQKRMGSVIDNLLQINSFSDKRVVYDFSGQYDHQWRAVVIDMPLLDVSDDGLCLSVRYLAATTLGFGYIMYDEFSPADKTVSDDIVDINLYSPKSETGFKIKDLHQREAGYLKLLDHYFRTYASQQYGSNEYFHDLHFNKKAKVYSRGQILDCLATIEIRGRITEDSTDFDIASPPSGFKVEGDLQIILDKLEEKRQREIDEANLRLEAEMTNLNLADSVLNTLSSDFGDPEVHKSIRQRVVGRVREKLKRKNS